MSEKCVCVRFKKRWPAHWTDAQRAVGETHDVDCLTRAAAPAAPETVVRVDTSVPAKPAAVALPEETQP